MSDSDTNTETPRNKRREQLIKAKDKAGEYIDYQIKAFRFGLLILGVTLVESEVSDLKAGFSFNLDRFFFILVICGMIAFTVWVEDKEGVKKQARKLIAIKDNLTVDLQGESFKFLLTDLIKEAKGVDEKIRVIQTVPRILNLMPLEQIEKTMAQGFQGLVETLSIYIHQFDQKGIEIKADINEALEEMLIKLGVRKNTAEGALVPGSKEFPKAVPLPPTKENIDKQLKNILADKDA